MSLRQVFRRNISYAFRYRLRIYIDCYGKRVDRVGWFARHEHTQLWSIVKKLLALRIVGYVIAATYDVQLHVAESALRFWFKND